MTHVINQGMAMYWGTSRWSAMEIMVSDGIVLNWSWTNNDDDRKQFILHSFVFRKPILWPGSSIWFHQYASRPSTISSRERKWKHSSQSSTTRLVGVIVHRKASPDHDHDHVFAIVPPQVWVWCPGLLWPVESLLENMRTASQNPPGPQWRCRFNLRSILYKLDQGGQTPKVVLQRVQSTLRRNYLSTTETTKVLFTGTLLCVR